MHLENEIKLDYKDVLIRPKRSTLVSRSEVNLKRTLTFSKAERSMEMVPIIAANMDTVGTMAMADTLYKSEMMTALHKFYDVQSLANYYKKIGKKRSRYIFYTLGIKDSDVTKLAQLLKVIDSSLVPNLCIDVANGYTERFGNFVRKIRKLYPDKVIMAGNVVTGEMTEELILAGADIVKVGIGSGSACITRTMTGIGYPQLSAVIECADAAHGVGGLICADGGCTVPGDIVKAFGAGADFVMAGGMLAGHDESEADIIEDNGNKFVEFYGSSSVVAMMKHQGEMPAYRAGEGRYMKVPYKGPVSGTVQDILGGLRSACTYVGAKSLKELSKRTTFIRVSQQVNTTLASYEAK